MIAKSVGGRKLPLLLLLSWVASVCSAQAVDALPAHVGAEPKPLSFEVVSIRRNPAEMSPQTAKVDFPANGDGLILTDIVLSSIVGTYYDHFQDTQEGMPDWANHECYDIRAKVAEADLAAYHSLSKVERKRMVQAMLEERFKLRVHPATKEAPMYALTVAKGGLKIKQASVEQAYTSGPTGPDGKFQGGTLFITGPGEETAHGVPMPMFANRLQQSAGRQIIDKTGLAGAYDFVFRWSPGNVDGPSLFTALEEQLGLKLEPARGAIETLVIDHIERPTEN